MTKSVGPQQNIFYTGVVEDRDDPLKLGRVRVRILGIHTESTTDIPKEDLPWAPIVVPPTQGACSGIGMSSHNLVPGTWVMVFFADGINLQNPVVLGAIHGIHPSTKPVNKVTTKEQSEHQIRAAGVSASGDEIKTGAKDSSEDVVTTDGKSAKRLGHISEKYESGNRGPGTISNGTGDAGGKSYGIYQFASKTGSLQEFIRNSAFRSKLSGCAVAGTEFDSKWKSIAASNPIQFREDQHNQIEKKFFTPILNKCKFLNVENRTDAISEMLWSYAVQYGPGGGATKIKRALHNRNVADLSDADIIEICYNDRLKNTEKDFSKSKTLWGSLKSRFINEKQDVLNYCGQKPTDASKTTTSELETDASGNIDESKVIIYNTPSYEIQGAAGFADPDGIYPKKDYLSNPSTNKLARNEGISKTIQKFKKLSVVKGNGFIEPHTFAPIWPYNKVLETESGHVFEIDDTPDNERIHVYHKSGSFVEIHPDGTIVKKSVKDDKEIILSDKGIYVFGNSSVFVEGDAKIQSLGNMKLESESNVDISAGGNLNISAAGNLNLISNGPLTTSSNTRIDQRAPDIKQQKLTASENITVDIGERIKLLAEVANEEEPDTPDDYDFESDASNQTFGSKSDLDKNAGYSTETGTPLTTAKQINVGVSKVGNVDTSTVDSAASFPGSFRLSENFVLSDLTTNVAAFKYKLRAQLGLSEQDIVKNLMYLAVNILEPINSHFGKNTYIISNAFRHSKGSSKSQHYKGMAVDLQFPGATLSQIPHIAQEIKLLLPNWGQLILEYHAKNPVIHVSYDLNKLNKMVFTTYSSSFSGLRPFGIYDRNQNLIYTA